MIKKAILWSDTVNKKVANLAKDVPLIPGASKTINYICEHADIIVVSNTPSEVLKYDWSNCNINNSVSLICGQETGSKIDILEAAIIEKYDKEKVLMIGDSPSDFYAAKKNDISFFPIIPGKEDSSWALESKVLSRFFLLKKIANLKRKRLLSLSLQSMLN